MRKRTIVLLLAGALCLIAAVGLAGYNIWDEQRAATSAQTAAALVVSEIPRQPQQEQPIRPEPQPMMTTVELDNRYYVGLLEIPELDLSLPIQRDWSDALLRYSPCVYKGTLADGMIIAGHNYRSHFASLTSLREGAQVNFLDLDGNVWSYTVVTTEIINGYDVEAMEAGDWDLTLFTCTYGGQERFTVRCELNVM